MNRTKIISRAPALLFIMLLVCVSCRSRVPEPPAIAGPALTYADDACSFAAVSRAGLSDVVGYRFAWGDDDTSTWTDWTPQGTPATTNHTWTTPDSYLLHAQARNGEGFVSDWSDPHPLFVSAFPTAPEPPDGPAHARAGFTCLFSVNVAGVSEARFRYRIDWGNGDTSYWSVLRQAGVPACWRYAWPATGKYNVRAIAQHESGRSTAWSAPLRIRIGLQPTAPEVSGPTDCFIDSTYTFRATSRDPDQDSIRILFTWLDGTEDTSALLASGDTVEMDRTWTATCSSDIRVIALDEMDGPSDSTKHPVRVCHLAGTRKWHFASGKVTGGPALGPDGTIYFGSADNNLYAVAPDGTLRWSYASGADIISSPAIGPDGTIYFGNDAGLVFALNPDGTEKWRCPTAGSDLSSPAVGADGSVYIGSDDNHLYAINANGSLKWRFRTGGNVWSSPAIGPDKTIYFGSCDDNVYALYPDGALKWQYDTDENVYASPAIGPDGTIYVPVTGEGLYAFNPDGTVRWFFNTGGSRKLYNSAAIDADGNIYFHGTDQHLHALTPDGDERWRYYIRSIARSSPALGANGWVYVGSSDDHLHAIGPDGIRRWRYRLRSDVYSSPVLSSDSIIYVGSRSWGTQGGLHAIRCGTTLADAPWPMFMHDPQHTGRVDGP